MLLRVWFNAGLQNENVGNIVNKLFKIKAMIV